MRFFVTFGDQYRREAHPKVDYAHPDGWVEIEAADEEQARKVAIRFFDVGWSMLYSEEDFDSDHARADWYPLGVLARITWGGTVTQFWKFRPGVVAERVGHDTVPES